MIQRTKTKAIFVKDVQIGNQNRVIIQSMSNLSVKNIEQTISLINDLAKHGCEIIRVAILDHQDAESLKQIIPKIPIPLVADIHYKYDLALLAIKNGAHKIRINPGNISNPEHLKQIIDACQQKKIPIRIGINCGSLPRHIVKQYGRTAFGLIEAAKEAIKLIESFNFNNFAISVKSTDPFVGLEAYKYISDNYNYPLHLGITEAGTLTRGIVLSAFSLGKLLEQGIGDTIRISLTTDPIHEVLAAKELLNMFKLTKPKPKLIACPTCGRKQFSDMFKLAEQIDEYLTQITGDIKIAIMGCAVNGLGEAEDAQITIVGNNKQGMFYIDGKLEKIVPENQILDELKTSIKYYLNNK